MHKANLFFFVTIFYLLSGIDAYTPLPGVYWYSYALADTKLYFKTEEVASQFFYLDVSKPFNATDTSSIPWADTTLTNIPIRDREAACVGGINNSSIFLLGGNMTESDPYGLVAQYDIIQQQWKEPTISGIVPNNKPSSLPCTSTKDGLIYIFSTDRNTSISEMNILNTVTLTWSSGSLINAPLLAGGGGFTATLLPNDTILYIGGQDAKGNKVPWDTLPLYDIKNDTWSYITTSNEVPSPRDGHTAVLAPDDRIIIIGGLPVSQFIVLDIKTYEWSYPSIDSLDGRPAPSISYHTATLLGKYMLIGFGYTDRYQTDIYLMDISDRNNYRWTNLYDPSSFLNSIPTPASPSNSTSLSLPPPSDPTSPSPPPSDSTSPSPSPSNSTSPSSSDSSSSPDFSLIVSLGILGFVILLITAVLITIRILNKRFTCAMYPTDSESGTSHELVGQYSSSISSQIRNR